MGEQDLIRFDYFLFVGANASIAAEVIVVRRELCILRKYTFECASTSCNRFLYSRLRIRHVTDEACCGLASADIHLSCFKKVSFTRCSPACDFWMIPTFSNNYAHDCTIFV